LSRKRRGIKDVCRIVMKLKIDMGVVGDEGIF
jgi:hypothetical protein